jgi:hypothetical protein
MPGMKTNISWLHKHELYSPLNEYLYCVMPNSELQDFDGILLLWHLLSLYLGGKKSIPIINHADFIVVSFSKL